MTRPRACILHYSFFVIHLKGFGLGILHAEGLHGDRLHALVLQGLVVVVPLGGHDAVGHFHALDDLAEGGVSAVQVGSLLHHDEELASGGVRPHGAGHGQHATVVGQIVLETVLGKLTLDGVAGAADADALGVAALNHEAGNDTVENEAVVEALLHQRDEVVDGVGSHLGVQLGLHDAAVLHFKGDDRILSHGNFPFPYINLICHWVDTLGPGLIGREYRMDERFFCQTRRFYEVILCV